MVLACKASGRHVLVGHMAAAMAVHLDPTADAVLTWVPTSPDRERRRGFDHARLLARELSRLTGLRHLRLLIRRTDSQEGRSRAERGQVVFDPVPDHRLLECAAGASIVVVVDDVRTTGASLSAAARALIPAGVAAVAGLTYAATPDPARR